jgi:hypothetical protein
MCTNIYPSTLDSCPLAIHTPFLSNYLLNQEIADYLRPLRGANDLSAERAGFEPAIPFRVYTLSRRAPSTTRTPLLKGGKNTISTLSLRIFFEHWPSSPSPLPPPSRPSWPPGPRPPGAGNRARSASPGKAQASDRARPSPGQYVQD